MYIEFDDAYGYWAVLDWADNLVCYCSTKESAEKVVSDWVSSL